MRSNWASALVIALACSAAVAQVASEPAESEGSQSAAEKVRLELESRSSRWVGALRARLSYPQIASVGVGALLTSQPEDHECVEVCHYRGLIMQAEPGLAGGQFSIGWGRLVADRRRDGPFLTDVYVGWGLRAAVLRTWGDSPLDPEDQTLVGLEGQAAVAKVGFTLGVMRRVSPHQGGGRTVVTGGIGWGF